MVAAVLIISLFICIIVGIPIAFSLAISAFCALLTWGNIPLKVIAQRMFTGIDSFPLMAIPFFMLAGELMTSGGILKGLVKFADALVGRIRGGLGHVNILNSMFFAGITGSASADVAALGPIEIGMMTEAGYDRDYSAALTAASATIGPIIPPSIPMAVYAVAAGNVSIGGLFLAGALPGVLIGLGMMGINYLMSLKRNYPRRETRLTLREFLRAFKEAILALIMPLIILGGILAGVFTPTEAAAVAVGYALVIGFFVTRELNPKKLAEALLRAGITTGVALFVLATANTFSWLMATQQLPQLVAQFLLNLSENPYVFLLLVNIFLIVVGCFIDNIAALVILVPILAPIANNLGINPLHFGIIVTINLIIGLITPPMGLCLFLSCTVGETTLEKISKRIWPFVVLEIVILLLLTYVPAITMTLPRILGFSN